MNNPTPETLLLLTLRYGLVSGKIGPRDFGILPQVLLGANEATGGHMRHMRVQPGPETPLFPALGNPANGQLFLTTHGPNREMGLWLRRGDAGDGELIGPVLKGNSKKWEAVYEDFIGSMGATRCWSVPAAMQPGNGKISYKQAMLAVYGGAVVMRLATDNNFATIECFYEGAGGLIERLWIGPRSHGRMQECALPGFLEWVILFPAAKAVKYVPVVADLYGEAGDAGKEAPMPNYPTPLPAEMPDQIKEALLYHRNILVYGKYPLQQLVDGTVAALARVVPASAGKTIVLNGNQIEADLRALAQQEGIALVGYETEMPDISTTLSEKLYLKWYAKINWVVRVSADISRDNLHFAYCMHNQSRALLVFEHTMLADVYDMCKNNERGHVYVKGGPNA